MNGYQFQLLNTAVEVNANGACRSHINGFVKAYQGELKRLPLRVSNRLRIAISTKPSGHTFPGGQVVRIHRSKHEYWNVVARRDPQHPGRFIWSDRSLEVVVSKDGSEIGVYPMERPNFAQLGEAAFHVARSFAIYRRNTQKQTLLHGSAVSTPRGAIIFLGPSGAGKTTFLLAGLAHESCVPLSNDRVCLRLNTTPVVVSWPSYISLCESTICASRTLKNAAQSASRRPPSYMTLHWPKHLVREIGTTRKRIYPPLWLTNATKRKFAESARLLGICLLAPKDETSMAIRKLSFDSIEDVALVHDALIANSFDNFEPAFLPWHEISLPHQQADSLARAIVSVARNAGIKLLSVNPSANLTEGYFDRYVRLLDDVIRHCA